MREQGMVFGEVAERYDEVRAGYPVQLVDAILTYVDSPRAELVAVEVGAGTGKATQAFLARGLRVTCLEPDPLMAAVLRRRFPEVSVTICRFEDWSPPPGGVPLLVASQSWHWLDASTRCARAYAALSEDGALALCGHNHAFADLDLERALDRVYAHMAPELMAPPGKPAIEQTFAGELAGSGLFADIHVRSFLADIPYPTARYVRLLETFSNHRLLPANRRDALHARIREVVDEYGGRVVVRLDTSLVLARRSH